jgi:hypothetical protein
MGTMGVVVPGVDPKDLLEVAAADDQQPVLSLGSARTHPTENLAGATGASKVN